MDIATLVGLTLAVGGILLGQYAEGGSLMSIMQLTAAIIVFCGTIGAVMISFPMESVKQGARMARVAFREDRTDFNAVIGQLVGFAEKTRREGLLSLEQVIKDVPDAFTQRALQLVADGTDPDMVRSILETDLDQHQEHLQQGAKVFEAAGGYAPTIGIIGAVLGLIHVMENLSDPGKLGSGIAVAFVATVYGVASANILFLPMASKIKERIKEQMLGREMVVEGILGVQSGDNPYLIREKMLSYLNDKHRRLVRDDSGQGR